jgi:glycosyltransferase involved in cell wall biosynthesis
MATGLPVLGIHSVGVGDIIVDGETGFLSSQDQAAFASKMTRLCLDRPLRQKMGAAARAAAEKYDIERTTNVIIAQYERLVFGAIPRHRGLGYRLRSMVERFRR